MSLNESQKRQREQCFLASFIDLFARENRASNSAGSTQFREQVAQWAESQGISGEGAEVPVDVATGTKDYSNFVSVMTANPGLLINKLVTEPNIQELFRLSPQKMSAVVPKMRLFKMYYDNADDVVGTAKEFVFDTHYDLNQVESLLTSRGERGGGVGIKSFSWELIGTNTAEVDNNISATLKIFFQSFADFVNEDVLSAIMDSSSPDDPAPADDIILNNQGSPHYLDLIFRTSKYTDSQRADRQRIFNERYYRIKALLGWSVDQAMVTAGVLTQSEKDLVESTGTMLLLSLLKHDIDFREDGTVELTLQYHAAIDTTLGDDSSNVLYVPKTFQIDTATYDLSESGINTSSTDYVEVLAEIDNAIATAEGRREELEAEQSAQEGGSTPQQDGCSDIEQPLSSDGDTEDLLEQNTEDLEKLRQFRDRLQYSIYTRILTEILDSRSVRYIDLPESYFQEEPLSGDDALTAAAQRTTGGIGRGSDTYNEAIDDLTRRLDANITGAGGLNLAEDTGEERAEDTAIPFAREVSSRDYTPPTPEALSQQAAALGIGTPQGEVDSPYRFHYIYLGDIMEQALKCLNPDINPQADADKQSMRVLMGTILIQLPDFRSKNDVLVNLADVPISVNLFMQFFLERTVAIGRTTWPIATFIKEIISLLLFPALGSDCAERRTTNRRPRAEVNISTVSAYSGPNGEDRVAASIEDLQERPENPAATEGGEGGSVAGRIIDSAIQNLNTQAGPLRLQDRRIYNYLIIQATDFSTFGRNVQDPEAPDRDKGDGIYWLNIGNDSGLVKSIKFKKTDQPGLAEARQEREGTLSLGQIRDKYDADVTLFGNALFQPGQIIFIHPTARGIGGLSTRMSSILGIGGYHQIISVDNNISENNYETVLNTKWVSSGIPGDEFCPEEEGVNVLDTLSEEEIERRTLQQQSRLERAARDAQGRQIASLSPEERAAANEERRRAGLVIPSTYGGERLRDMEYDRRQEIINFYRDRQQRGLSIEEYL